jgi:hypothetical protein
MARTRKGGSSIKQMAYARAILGAKGTSKQQIALNVGYSPNSARSIMSHVENTPGFHNAMSKLAMDSNNIALAAMEEFKARGFKDFSNKDLVGALNAIGSAWSRFNADPQKKRNEEGKANRLRTLVLQRVENQIITGSKPKGGQEYNEPQIEKLPEFSDENFEF